MEEYKLKNWMHAVENQHPSVRYTFEISQSSITFLDITFKHEDVELTSSVHYKPTDSHSYLDYQSFHPPSTKNAIPYSQCLWLRCLITKDDEFKEKKEITSFFKERGYPSDLLEKASSRTRHLSQNDLIANQKPSTKMQRIPLVTTYHPRVNQVYKIIEKKNGHT